MAGVVVLIIVIGTILGPKKSDQTTTSSAPSATTSSEVVTPSSEPYVADLASRPSPTEAQVREIGIKLAAIQPQMADISVSQIESWSDSMCGDIWTQRVDDLAGVAVKRFAGGGRPPLSQEQGQQIVDVIASTYCRP